MRWLVVVLAVVLAGCGIIGCDPETEIIEVVPGEPFAEFSEDLVRDLRDDGWDCDGESIRNAAGTAIGTRYTCTSC